MVDATSRLTHILDRFFLKHFCFNFPQTTPCYLLRLLPTFKQQLATMLLNKYSTKACTLQSARNIPASGINGASSVAGYTLPQISKVSITQSHSSIFFLNVSMPAFYPRGSTSSVSAQCINIYAPLEKYLPLWGPTTPGKTGWSSSTFVWADSSRPTRRQTLLLPVSDPSPCTS